MDMGDLGQDHYYPPLSIPLNPGKVKIVKFSFRQLGSTHRLHKWERFKFLIKYGQQMSSIDQKLFSGEFDVKY
jgi:hypothetical protein